MSEAHKTASADPQADLRREFVRTMREQERARAALVAEGVPMWELAKHLPSPYGRFAELRCGAKSKRTGQPCRLTSIYDNGRCKFHGGLSTGPRTAWGKRRSAANGSAPKRSR